MTLLILVGCTGNHDQRSRIFWPLEDGEPQLEFIGNIRSDLDLMSSGKRKLLKDILGERAEVILKRPFGIVSIEPGVILVTDPGLGEIFRFDFNRRLAKPFSPQFSGIPMGIDCDAAGNIYVVNTVRSKVNVFTPHGRLLAVIGDNDRLERPSYIAVNRELNRIYVADAPRHRIVVYETCGNYLFDIGRPGAGPGEFAAPQGMAIDSSGRLFVADMLNARIQVFDPDGRFLYKFGQQGTEFWDFENPRDLAFSGDGILYVVDHRKALLLAYRPDGQFLFALGKDKATSHPWGFSTPTSVSIGEDGALYVTEQMNKRFSVWQLLTDSYLREKPLTMSDREELEMARKKYYRLQANRGS